MPLRLALLGFDDDVPHLIRAAQPGSGFEVVIFCDEAPLPEELRRLVPLARYEPQWESLLLGNQAEAVVVARSPDRELRADQLRKLVQAGVPLLVMPATCEAIVGFEIDMIRRDTLCTLVPYVPGGKHPAVRELAGWVDAGATGPLGTIEQLAFERGTRDRARQHVVAQLARDMGLVRAIAGNLTRVSAMGAAAEEAALANLSVQLSGPAGILVRWSLEPAQSESTARLTLLGSAGRAVLSMPADERDWQLLRHSAAPGEPLEWPEANGARLALESLAGALAGKEISPTWLEACRDMELAETALRSSARGRTIELHQEEHSEEETFKGIMSVGGCMMLAVGLAGLLAAFAVGGVQMLLRDPDARPEPSSWPLWLKLWPVYPFVLFLLLQLLQLVFRRSPPEPSTPDKPRGASAPAG